MRDVLYRSPERDSAADLTTIVVTRGRVGLLARALRTLMAQESVALHVILVIDACPATMYYAATVPPSCGAIQSIRVIYQPRSAGDHTGPRRVATLRTIGLAAVRTRWCSYLDDDNELQSTHYADLFTCVHQSPSPAAHSWRSLWERGGRPFLLANTHPWCRDTVRAVTLFEQYRRAGIYQIASNIVRDRVVPGRRSESMVDMSEWVFETDFIREIGFVDRYNSEDWQTSRAEDSKLLDEIVARHLPIPSSKSPTLRYYLGGYSNNWASEGAQLCGWG